MNTNADTVWLEINLGAIRRNIHRLHQISGRPVMAVVKANAYGHGLLEVSRAVLKGGAERLCVARFEEALALRLAGIDAPILVLGYTSPEHAIDSARLNISLAVFRQDTAQAYALSMVGEKHQLKLHVKVDTGMGRLGVFPEDAPEFVNQLRVTNNLLVEGLFTHFSSADDTETETTELQIAKFNNVIAGLEASGVRPGIIHASNSAGTLKYPQAAYDAVRPGIAVYGLDPSSEVPLPPEFEPALTWKTRLVSIKTLPPGSGVGYNHRYVTKGYERVGACAVGYADGLRRKLGNQALIHGIRVPQLGGMCMDQSVFALGAVPDAKPGDEVVLVGRQGDEFLSAEEVGASWGTINYDVVCGLAARVPRYYFDD
ncbi:MAG: alanine racemase [Anaerolineaceae bacterium]|jgi:alanine racemase